MTGDLNGDILQHRVNLQVGLENVVSIIEVNKIVLDIANQKLDKVKSELDSLQVGGGVKKNIDNAIELLNGLDKNQQIREQREVIREQVIVLLIGNLEVYIAEIIKLIGNSQPELFRFSNPKEQLEINQDMLNSGFRLGDAILEHIINKGHSFQDLGSTLKAFSKYFSLDIELEDILKDDLILCAAIRHCIIHNMTLASKQFLRQIRDTRYSQDYALNKPIFVDDALVNRSKEAILEFADQITANFIQEDIAS